MVGAKKSKKNYTPKFGKPKQMKMTDYHSSSDDDEEPAPKRSSSAAAATKPDVSVPQDDSRLSDDSEHNLDDDEDEDEAEEASDDEPEEDVEFDDEVSDEDEEASSPAEAAPASKTHIQGSDGEDEEEDDDADDADADAEDDDEDDEDDDATEGNADWAKSLAKILKQEKPKNKKIVALSKAKKTSDIIEAREKAKAIGFAIDGEVKEEKPDAAQLNAALDAEALTEQKRKKKEAFTLRIKPTLMDRERERAFKKIATKGVVQLFNAVRMQQRDLSEQLEQAGRLDHRRDAVLNNINKRKFLDVLMGGKRAKSENVDNPIKDELKEEDDDGSDMDDMDDAVYNDGLPKNSIWSVLKEDFLSNKKMSHWDKDEEEDGAANTDGEEADSN